MGGRIGVLVVVAGLILAPSSAAAGGEALVAGDPPLALSCQGSFTVDVALLCDPSTRLRGGSLTISGFGRLDSVDFGVFSGPSGPPQVGITPTERPVSGCLAPGRCSP